MLSDHTGPGILAGDLNAWSSKRQLVADEFTRCFGLGPIDFIPDLRAIFLVRPLDIYVRGMHSLGAEVVSVSGSDHNPLQEGLGFI